ncbi:MAG: tetrahydrofolate dehydrogenase/cyclohydrolase catalytic domain-containing protein [Bacteroidales bacterium]|nr:tetrahydrofolate dehydrogenase/cyclohydrolase catalytic domain-containing protein [Bacteroidales bacterium]
MLIDGKLVKREKLLALKEELAKLQSMPCLCVVQVGEDEASKVYVKQKQKLCEELGYRFIHKALPADIDEVMLIQQIDLLNLDDEVDGIIVQMPLPKHLDPIKVLNTISPEKDVDGLTFINSGKLLQGAEGFVPCTPKGVIDLLNYYGITIEGQTCLVIGRSILVGKPMAHLLLDHNGTVVVAHSKTPNLKELSLQADIIISCVGKKWLITEDMVKDGAVIIDVGINREDGKLYGDVDFDRVSQKASYITPVPGGVGQMTVYELCENTHKAYVKRKKS